MLPVDPSELTAVATSTTAHGGKSRHSFFGVEADRCYVPGVTIDPAIKQANVIGTP